MALAGKGEPASLARDTRAWEKALQFKAKQELGSDDRDAKPNETRIEASAHCPAMSGIGASHVAGEGCGKHVGLADEAAAASETEKGGASKQAQTSKASLEQIAEVERETLGRVFRSVDGLSYKLVCLHEYLDLDDGRSSMRPDADQLRDNVASLRTLVLDTQTLVLQAAQEQQHAHERAQALAMPASVPFYCTYSSPHTRYLFPSPHKGQATSKNKQGSVLPETAEGVEGPGVGLDSMLSSAVTPLTCSVHTSARQQSAQSGDMLPSMLSPHHDGVRQQAGQDCPSALATSLPPLPCFICPAVSPPLLSSALDTSRHDTRRASLSPLQVFIFERSRARFQLGGRF